MKPSDYSVLSNYDLELKILETRVHIKQNDQNTQEGGVYSLTINELLNSKLKRLLSERASRIGNSK